jgi:hypothetical protein
LPDNQESDRLFDPQGVRRVLLVRMRIHPLLVNSFFINVYSWD